MQASSTTSVEVVTAMTSKKPVFSGNHGDDWTIWEMMMLTHLMEKGIGCMFGSRFQNKTAGQRDGNGTLLPHLVCIHFSSSDLAFQRRILTTMQCYPYIPTSSHSPYI